MTNPTSIESYVNDVLTDLGVLNTEADDFDRVDIGWSEAMEAIKGLIEDGVPLKEEDKSAITAETLMAFFDEDEPHEIARYLAMQLTQHNCVSLIEEIQISVNVSEVEYD